VTTNPGDHQPKKTVLQQNRIKTLHKIAII